MPFLLSASKVAPVTFLFWLTKICATTIGETGGDLFSMTLHWGYLRSSVLFLAFLAITLVLQLRTARYHPTIYWAVIVATSTAGTTLADFADRSLGIGYVGGCLILTVILIAVLFSWWRSTGSLAVGEIVDRRTEMFYWAAIIASNTLGTAAGDTFAHSLNLGFGISNLVIGAAIALIAVLYFLTRLPRTALFWPVFVLTRPFGATLGDVLTKEHNAGGFGVGTTSTTVILLMAMIVLVGYDTWQRQPWSQI